MHTYKCADMHKNRTHILIVNLIHTLAKFKKYLYLKEDNVGKTYGIQRCAPNVSKARFLKNK